MSCSKAGNRHAIRRAGNVIQANLVELGDGIGIATMLAANARDELGVGGAATLDGDVDELDDAIVDCREGVDLHDAEL